MIKITVPGQPIAQQRPRFSKANFKVFDPNREDKIEIREKIRSKAPKKPFEGGVYLTLNFYTQRPLQHFVGKKRDNKLSILLCDITWDYSFLNKTKSPIFMIKLQFG